MITLANQVRMWVNRTSPSSVLRLQRLDGDEILESSKECLYLQDYQFSNNPLYVENNLTDFWENFLNERVIRDGETILFDCGGISQKLGCGGGRMISPDGLDYANALRNSIFASSLNGLLNVEVFTEWNSALEVGIFGLFFQTHHAFVRVSLFNGEEVLVQN